MNLVRAIIVSFLVCALASSAVWGAEAKQPTTAGSFLKYRAGSPTELANMVRQDPVLSARYSMHFGATDAGVADFFQNQLKLIRLRQSKTAIVYFIGSGGKVVSNKRVFPAGTLVFATQQGEPILDWRCGNPLASSLPLTQARAAAKETVSAASTAQPETQLASLPDPQEVVEQVLDQPPIEFVAPVLQAAALTPPTAPIMVSAVPPVVEAIAMPAVNAMESVPALAQGSRGFGWLLPIAALGGAIGGVGGRGASPPQPGPSPVPEPGSLITLVSGALATGVGAFRMRKRARIL